MSGAAVWDTGGRRFTDFTMGWRAVLLGHGHPAVVEAVRSQVALGNFAYVSEPALELAEELVRAVALYRSLAHSEADIGRFLDTARDPLREGAR